MAMIIGCAQRVRHPDRTNDDVLNQRMIVDPGIDDADQRRVTVKRLDSRKILKGEINPFRRDQIELGGSRVQRPLLS